MEISRQGSRLVAEKDEHASAQSQLFAKRILFGIALVVAVVVPISVINTWRDASETEGITLFELILSVAPAVMVLISAPLFLRNSFSAIDEGEIVRVEVDTRRRIILFRTRTIDESVETYHMLGDMTQVDLIDTSTDELTQSGIAMFFRDGSAQGLLTLGQDVAVDLWDKMYTLLREEYPRIAWYDRRPNKQRKKLPTDNLSMMARAGEARRFPSAALERAEVGTSAPAQRGFPRPPGGEGASYPSPGTRLQSPRSGHRSAQGRTASSSTS